MKGELPQENCTGKGNILIISFRWMLLIYARYANKTLYFKIIELLYMYLILAGSVPSTFFFFFFFGRTCGFFSLYRNVIYLTFMFLLLVGSSGENC